MKKILIALLSLASTTVLAEEYSIVPVVSEEQIASLPAQLPPILKLGVYDTSDGFINEVTSKKYSIKNSGHNLCWIAFNLPFGESNHVVETFVAPKKTAFNDPPSHKKVSKSGRTHTISLDLPSENNLFIQRCWRFDKKDPIGQYKVTIKINEYTFPAQIFEVVK